VKDLNRLTNHRHGFQLQLGRLNDRAISILTLEAHIVAQSSHTTPAANAAIEDTYVTRLSLPIRLHTLEGRLFNPVDELGMDRTHKLKGVWTSVERAAELTGIADLPHVLAAFVRDQKRRLPSQRHCGGVDPEEAHEVTPEWLDDMRVQIHPSMTCWIADGKHPTDTEVRVRQLVRCSPLLTSPTSDWKRDYAIAVESSDRLHYNPNPDDVSQRLHGKAIGRVDIIFTVQEICTPRSLKDPPSFTSAVLNRVRILDRGRTHPVHGMIETLPSANILADPITRRLGSRRAYGLAMMRRGVHIIPSGLPSGVMYVNNYIDFEMYNTLYSPTYKEDRRRLIKEFREH
jgi:hypothetical protein